MSDSFLVQRAEGGFRVRIEAPLTTPPFSGFCFPLPHLALAGADDGQERQRQGKQVAGEALLCARCSFALYQGIPAAASMWRRGKAG